MIRLAHFSDIHITTPRLGWTWRDWFSRRLTSWLNLRVLGRGKRFANAEIVLSRFLTDVRTQNVDHLVFSGDATALGFRAEIEHAAQALNLDGFSGLAVPGNHDYCTVQAARSGDFEQCFASWQRGERVDGACYPFAQRVGDYWLVAVNSARGNRWFWDARGFVAPDECKRLARLLAHLPPGPRILVTHYPICLADGRPESRSHRLINLDAVLEIAARGGVTLWLHGHRHGFYLHERTRRAAFPVLCAGSATQTDRWSYGLYTLQNRTLEGSQRQFDASADRFCEVSRFSLTLGGEALSSPVPAADMKT
jgi:3',5'-cyclic AMP phosphodiesterase CpdA